MLPKISTAAVRFSRGIAQLLGNEIAVVLSPHKIKITTVDPDKVKDKSWDSSLFVSGNVYLEGYANPVKPIVRNEQPDKTGDIIVSDRQEPDETQRSDDNGKGEPESVDNPQEDLEEFTVPAPEVEKDSNDDPSQEVTENNDGEENDNKEKQEGTEENKKKSGGLTGLLGSDDDE